jgi:hypothetical protein
MSEFFQGILNILAKCRSDFLFAGKILEISQNAGINSRYACSKLRKCDIPGPESIQQRL